MKMKHFLIYETGLYPNMFAEWIMTNYPSSALPVPLLEVFRTSSWINHNVLQPTLFLNYVFMCV